MSRKIVAIGGGENERIKSDGTRTPYETAPMDKEIIRLSGKEKPNVLLIAHSQKLENQEFYYQVIKNIYFGKYGCEVKDLKSDKLTDEQYVKELIDWADVIYEGGGNTLDMIKLWKETGFDKVLRQAWESGKVMCGVSAGAICWFKECTSDSLRIIHNDPTQPLIKMDCLGFVDGLCVPHTDAPGRFEDAKETLKTTDEVGLLISNCSSLVIVDDTYKIVTSDASNYNITPFVKKAYWNNDEFVSKDLETNTEFRPISELYSRDEEERVSGHGI